MPLPTAPNSLAIGQAITSYLAALTYPSTASVYSLAQLEEIKDVTDLVANGAACAEVYGNLDDSQHKAFNGKVFDEQSWFILSLCSLDTAAYAQQIYSIRDAVVQPFQQHATLGNAGNVYHSQIKPGSGKFLKVFRNGIWLRGHLIEIMTRQEWFVPLGVVS